MKIMVAYDGTLQSKDALVYGMEKVRKNGGELIALHVFNSGLFIGYDGHIDAEAMARRDSARQVEEARALIREKGGGINAGLFTAEGTPEEELISFAKDRKADVLLCSPRCTGIIRKYRQAQAASDLAEDAAKMRLAVLSTKSS